METGVFDKSIFCQHLSSCLRVSCLQESFFCPNVSACPRPLLSVSADMGRLLPSRGVSGSYPPPSHSRHSESSLPSPSRLTPDTRRLLHGDLQQPAAGVQRGAGTCSWGAAACSSCIHWTHPDAGGFQRAATFCMKTDTAAALQVKVTLMQCIV